MVRAVKVKSLAALIIGIHYRQLLQVRLCHTLALGLVLSALGGCQSFSYQTLLQDEVITSEIYQSTEFKHRLFRSTKPPATTSDALHIYLEGDGRPWRGRYFIASNPTPSYGLMLDAMLTDANPSVYVGRPCYWHTEDAECDAMDWTMARYSEAVVDSLLVVIKDLSEDIENLWIIGHSGGGALAVLVGRRLQRQVNVLTIAANLDHAAWTQLHQFSPLDQSLNPMDDERRNPNMRELHWYGTQDGNIPPTIFETYCRQQLVTCKAENASHSGGWLQRWPEILLEAEGFFSGP